MGVQKSMRLAVSARMQLGAKVNLPAWGLLPYFALPENGVTLIAGETQTIYGDSLINVPIDNDLTVEYTCSIGTQSGNNLVLTTPVAGTYPCTITFKNKGLLIGAYTINLSVVAKVTDGTKKVLLIADSLLVQADTIWTNNINSVLSDSLITYVGTQGTTVKHEGRGGWGFYSFITAGSPFFKGGVLDIASYFADNSIDNPDIVFISLGINDLFMHCGTSDDGLTPADITSILNQAKTLIAGFLSYNANLKVVVSIPTICANNTTLWNSNYNPAEYSQDLYIENMHKWWMSFVSEFENNAYNARVSVSYEALFLDRNNYTNGVHTDTAGSNELGYAKAIAVNSAIKKVNEDSLIFTINTENAGSATKTFVLPTNGTGSNCVIDWGDGTTSAHTGTLGNITHVYPTTGIKTVKIFGQFSGIYFNNGGDKLKILTVSNWGKSQYTSFVHAFHGCANLTISATDEPDLSLIDSLGYAFYGCTLLTGDFSAWDVHTVVDMGFVFANCSNFNSDLSTWNPSSCVSTQYMFYSCSVFVSDISGWDVTKVTNMNYMFADAHIGTPNYDALLIAWSQLALKSNVVFYISSKYSAGAATTARGILTGTFNWNITDQGQV